MFLVCKIVAGIFMGRAFVQTASPVATLSSTFLFHGNYSVAVYPELVEGSLTSVLQTSIGFQLQHWKKS
jgi:hypothetical protein